MVHLGWPVRQNSFGVRDQVYVSAKVQCIYTYPSPLETRPHSCFFFLPSKGQTRYDATKMVDEFINLVQPMDTVIDHVSLQLVKPVTNTVLM